VARYSRNGGVLSEVVDCSNVPSESKHRHPSLGRSVANGVDERCPSL